MLSKEEMLQWIVKANKNKEINLNRLTGVEEHSSSGNFISKTCTCLTEVIQNIRNKGFEIVIGSFAKDSNPLKNVKSIQVYANKALPNDHNRGF